MPADLAVQIVSHRSEAGVRAVVPAVLADLDGSGLDARVLVLDNASGDALGGLDPQVEVVRSPVNAGFGAGHNALAARHDARALLLLNPDVRLLERGTVARLHAALRAAHDVAAVGPRHRTRDGAVDPRDHGELHGPRARIALAAGHSHYRVRSAPADVAWVSGACLLADRARFDAAGGFDPGFFLYKEEEDLCARLRARGGRIRYDPRVSVAHTGAAEAARAALLTPSVERYARKHVRSRVAPRVHRSVVVWGGRLDRVLGRR